MKFIVKLELDDKQLGACLNLQGVTREDLILQVVEEFSKRVFHTEYGAIMTKVVVEHDYTE